MVRNPGRLLLSLQNCPSWCATNYTKLRYILDLINCDRIPLALYPDVRAYYDWVARFYSRLYEQDLSDFDCGKITLDPNHMTVE